MDAFLWIQGGLGLVALVMLVSVMCSPLRHDTDDPATPAKGESNG